VVGAPREDSSEGHAFNGVAGGSAQRKADKLLATHARLNQRIKQEHRVLGGLMVAVRGDSKSAAAWSKGAVGERGLAAGLEKLLGGKAILLHDRRIPGSRANIDHLAISAAGIHIIDAKNYTGKIEQRDKGGWFSTDLRLFVGGRDRTALIAGMDKQVVAVAAATHDLIDPNLTAIRAALCFYKGEFPLTSNGYEISGVKIGRVKHLAKWICRDGALGQDQVAVLAARIAERLPAYG